MLNVVRSSVITSSRRTQYVGRPAHFASLHHQSPSNSDIQALELADDHSHSSHNKTPKIDRSKVPVVKEDELDERFISGWGPGGQKVNKAVNCCQLRHRPTGIIVKVQQSRSLEQNRKIARELIAQKLDNLYNGPESVSNQSKRIALQKIATRESQSLKRRAMKAQFRNAFGSESSD